MSERLLMIQKIFQIITGVVLLCLLPDNGEAKSDKFRLMWREDPSTTMVIGWNQVSGSHPILYMDVLDHGKNHEDYAVVKKPDRVVRAKGMNNFFVRLWGLKPNTTYYFLIKDDQGVSDRMYFKTAPNNPEERLSIIAGGDSRNNREARRAANRTVSKLRPHFIMFGGDMTAGDTDGEWKEWMDDWQLTFGSDGQIFPIIVTRGNHESENKSLIDLFDVKNEDCYYALTFGGGLLRIYTLNTLIPADGYQKKWLLRDLQTHQDITWKFAQYHHSIRPHTIKKPDQLDQQIHWAPAFYEFGVNLVVESDAHVVKTTWPIRPCSKDTPGSDEGYVRDDEKGTVYVGEGCWGAPLRANNDEKTWTRNSGSFNQFKWIFVDEGSIEVRTVVTDKSRNAREVESYDPFTPPAGLEIWNPSNGSVVKIAREIRKPLIDLEPIVEKPQDDNSGEQSLAFEEELQFEEEPAYENSEEDALKPRLGANMLVFDFKAIRSGKDMVIKWKTKNERADIEFEIQRSVGRDANFKTLCSVQGKGGSENDYFWSDKSYSSQDADERVNYRLKQIFPSGKSLYHDMKEIIQDSNDWSNYPVADFRAGSGDIAFNFALHEPADVTVLVISPHNQIVKRMQFRGQGPGNHSKKINVREIPTGQYLVVVRALKEVIAKYRVTK